MNQYFIIVLVWAASLVGLGLYENHVGHTTGVNEQKVEDQKQFDTVNAERAQQKADAAALMQSKQAEIIALQESRAKLQHDQEVKDAQNRKATLVLSANLATAKLQFRTVQSGADRQNCGNTVSAGTDSTGADGTAVVQLPDAVAAGLRQLTLDADQLKDEYAKCYGSYYPAAK